MQSNIGCRCSSHHCVLHTMYVWKAKGEKRDDKKKLSVGGMCLGYTLFTLHVSHETMSAYSIYDTKSHVACNKESHVCWVKVHGTHSSASDWNVANSIIVCRMCVRMRWKVIPKKFTTSLYVWPTTRFIIIINLNTSTQREIISTTKLKLKWMSSVRFSQYEIAKYLIKKKTKSRQQVPQLHISSAY